MTDGINRGGESTLLALIYPMRTEDMRPDQLTVFYEAAAEQERYAQSSGGRSVASESVGDVRVTYRDGGTWVVQGVEISPTAASMLFAAGLMNRWI